MKKICLLFILIVWGAGISVSQWSPKSPPPPTCEEMEQKIQNLTWERDFYKQQVELEKDREKWKTEQDNATDKQTTIIDANNQANEAWMAAERERLRGKSVP